MSFAELKNGNKGLVRKILDAAFFVKKAEEGDEEITQVWDGTDLVVPTGYNPVGLITRSDGINWTREVATSDVESLGVAGPTRRDITSDIPGLSVTPQESNATVLELWHMQSLENLTTDENGNVRIVRGERPVQQKWRGLAIGKDGDGTDAIYVARWLPDSVVTEPGEQTWNDESELNYPLTFTGFTDEEFGTSMVEVWGGPGLNHEAMGFPAPAGG